MRATRNTPKLMPCIFYSDRQNGVLQVDYKDMFIYPMPNLFMMEMEYEKDLERIKALYPKEVDHIQRCVDKRCNELEYEGSRMFDEEPDRLMIQMEVDRMCDCLRENSDMEDLRTVVGILFGNEMYRRRCRHRRNRRWW